jgi:hypothetical protein
MIASLVSLRCSARRETIVTFVTSVPAGIQTVLPAVHHTHTATLRILKPSGRTCYLPRFRPSAIADTRPLNTTRNTFVGLGFSDGRYLCFR